MTDKNTYWVRDAAGDYALLTGTDQRDRWLPHGWTEVDEPTGQEFVWARHEGIQEPARFPANALREVWADRGWKAAEPPSPISPFNSDEGAPVIPVGQSETSAKPSDAAPKPSQRTAANTKE